MRHTGCSQTVEDPCTVCMSVCLSVCLSVLTGEHVVLCGLVFAGPVQPLLGSLLLSVGLVIQYPLVVVINGNREYLLGPFLANDILIYKVIDLTM